MGVVISLPLFGTFGQELEEGAATRSKELRDLAGSLSDRLLTAADLLDTLAAAGWTARVAVHDLLLSHPDVASAVEAEQRLQALGVDPALLVIFEDVEEEETGATRD